MNLHARNIAIGAGVPLNYIQEAVNYMKKRKKIDYKTAKEFLKKKNINLDHSKFKL